MSTNMWIVDDGAFTCSNDETATSVFVTQIMEISSKLSMSQSDSDVISGLRESCCNAKRSRIQLSNRTSIFYRYTIQNRYGDEDRRRRASKGNTLPGAIWSLRVISTHLPITVQWVRWAAIQESKKLHSCCIYRKIHDVSDIFTRQRRRRIFKWPPPL